MGMVTIRIDTGGLIDERNYPHEARAAFADHPAQTEQNPLLLLLHDAT